MAKKKHLFVKIEFIGTDLVLENVRCVLVGDRVSLPFTHIDHRGDQWTLINGNGGLFDLTAGKPVEVKVQREEDKVTLESEGPYIDTLTRATRLSLRNSRIMHFDCTHADINQFREWRLSYTKAFITDTKAIQAIRITPTT